VFSFLDIYNINNTQTVKHAGLTAIFPSEPGLTLPIHAFCLTQSHPPSKAHDMESQNQHACKTQQFSGLVALLSAIINLTNAAS